MDETGTASAPGAGAPRSTHTLVGKSGRLGDGTRKQQTQEVSMMKALDALRLRMTTLYLHKARARRGVEERVLGMLREESVWEEQEHRECMADLDALAAGFISEERAEAYRKGVRAEEIRKEEGEGGGRKSTAQRAAFRDVLKAVAEEASVTEAAADNSEKMAAVLAELRAHSPVLPGRPPPVQGGEPITFSPPYPYLFPSSSPTSTSSTFFSASSPPSYFTTSPSLSSPTLPSTPPTTTGSSVLSLVPGQLFATQSAAAEEAEVRATAVVEAAGHLELTPDQRDEIGDVILSFTNKAEGRRRVHKALKKTYNGVSDGNLKRMMKHSRDKTSQVDPEKGLQALLHVSRETSEADREFGWRGGGES